jgi:hypothetical protein
LGEFELGDARFEAFHRRLLRGARGYRLRCVRFHVTDPSRELLDLGFETRLPGALPYELHDQHPAISTTPA